MLTGPASALLSSTPITSMSLAGGPLLTSTASILSKAVLPRLPLLLAASSPTALFQEAPDDSSEGTPPSQKSTARMILPPRARSCLWMTAAMSFHFGGYEFARSGALALFTSSATGFSHGSAYPFAMALVTPLSLVLLYWYGLLLKARGPRYALRTTKLLSVVVLLGVAGGLQLLLSSASSATSTVLSRILVAFLFVFQNSYCHLIFSQQWSFLGSVMTPTEGTKWFSPIAGICSLVCSLTATLVHQMADTVGLLGLIAGTGATLTLSLLSADRAYQLGELHGFDPSETMRAKTNKDDDKQVENGSSLFSKTIYLFQRVPTLAALFVETISFQSLSTVLNVFFVRQLKDQIPLDVDRASFSGRFYAYVNGVSALLQFLVLPLARKILEPKWVYRGMPVVLMPLLIYAALLPSSSSRLTVAALGFFALKTLDYSLRNIVNEMVYQPLDFESRYLGKEVIGVFANRFGKSGMSMILSFLTPLGWLGTFQLSNFAVGVGTIWSTSAIVLSRRLMSNADAEQRVQERQKKQL